MRWDVEVVPNKEVKLVSQLVGAPFWKNMNSFSKKFLFHPLYIVSHDTPHDRFHWVRPCHPNRNCLHNRLCWNRSHNFMGFHCHRPQNGRNGEEWRPFPIFLGNVLLSISRFSLFSLVSIIERTSGSQRVLMVSRLASSVLLSVLPTVFFYFVSE